MKLKITKLFLIINTTFPLIWNNRNYTIVSCHINIPHVLDAKDLVCSLLNP